MRLAEWRKREGRTQQWVADFLGVSQPYVSAIERAVGPLVPGEVVMRKVIVMTAGEVTANEWFPIAELVAQQARAG